MFKVILFIALAIAGAIAQETAPGNEAAPEPYSYGYETDTHSASEQRDPQGRVTGFYMLSDADGRQRRVEYVADEAGFRAKVQTNEMGTKAQNSADVEVQAAPPTQEQLYQAQAQQQQPTRQVVQTQQQQRVVAPQQQVAYTQQPGSYQSNYGYGYYPGYAYGNGANYYGNGYGYGSDYGYGNGYGNGYAYNPGYGYASGATYSSYNNHLPSSYYRSVGNAQQVRGYNSNNLVGRYVSQPGAAAVNTVRSSSYRTVPVGGASYQNFGVPSQGANYQNFGVPSQGVSYQTVGVPEGARSSSNLQGSSNYIVLKKRESTDKKESN